MRRLLMAFIFMIVAFGFSISADADGLSGLLVEIPGYTGSGVVSCADLSSAVMQPVDDGVVIIACVKTITRSGEEHDDGLWFFMRKDQDDHVYVKSGRGNEYRDMSNSPLIPNHQEYVDAFFENLRMASESNE